MRVVRIADLAPVPWRNGGGVTRDIGVGQGWRLSLADIDAPGQFSTYPGLRRAFALASGAVRLRFGVAEELRLDADSAPIDFAGEDAPHCAPEPGAGACRALNLMVAHDRLRGRLLRRTLRAGEALDSHEFARALAVVVQRGGLSVGGAGPGGTGHGGDGHGGDGHGGAAPDGGKAETVVLSSGDAVLRDRDGPAAPAGLAAPAAPPRAGVAPSAIESGASVTLVFVERCAPPTGPTR